MIFEWPILLWALLLVPLLALAYVLMERRRRALALTAARWSTSAPAAAIPRVRRIMPPILYLLALTLLIAAMARPVAVISLPSLRDVIILAIDVSNSMLADDVTPTRLEAAQKAARDFIEEQPATTQIGVVAFAETALAVQRPTTNREDLIKAIDRLKAQEGTAVGGAILVSLQALFPKEVFEVKSPEEKEAEAKKLDDPWTSEDDKPKPPPKKVPPGSEKSAAIVLLSDGAATSGPDPVEAAQLAADRGVRVFTVGLGTEEGAVVKLDGISMRVQIDEEVLKKIADVTLARFFMAANAEDLRAVYRDVSSRLVAETREMEISAAFVAAAATLALVAAALSVLWFNRIL
ncbi:MAG: VWA domain-containing protein [Rhodospirillaceae bacterium]|nr:VWA domain-containing protein [Rhodospirillaceae bacterium]